MKEYDNNNTGVLFLADKKTTKGESYYKGTITIDKKDYSITMFTNNSDNPKAPKFRIKVFDKVAHKEDNVGVNVNGNDNDNVFVDFANEIELTNDDLAF